MKRWICLIAAVMMMALPLLTASAVEIPTLEFVSAGLKSQQRFVVYSAPDTTSWRGHSGKAAVSTNGTVWCAGWEDGWLLVMYETNAGHIRIGYIRGSSIKGARPVSQDLHFVNRKVPVIASCTFTDDPVTLSTSVFTLTAGDEVTMLAMYGGWAYVETVTPNYKKTIRGFIPASCLDLLVLEDF